KRSQPLAAFISLPVPPPGATPPQAAGDVHEAAGVRLRDARRREPRPNESWHTATTPRYMSFWPAQRPRPRPATGLRSASSMHFGSRIACRKYPADRGVFSCVGANTAPATAGSCSGSLVTKAPDVGGMRDGLFAAMIAVAVGASMVVPCC